MFVGWAGGEFGCGTLIADKQTEGGVAKRKRELSCVPRGVEQTGDGGR